MQTYHAPACTIDSLISNPISGTLNINWITVCGVILVTLGDVIIKK